MTDMPTDREAVERPRTPTDYERWALTPATASYLRYLEDSNNALRARNNILRARAETAEAKLAKHDWEDWKQIAKATEAERDAAREKALREGQGVTVKPLEWDVDGRRLSMDDTMCFGKGYDWDGYECLRQEGYGLGFGYIIWPERIGGANWSLYGTYDGLFVTSLAGEEAAKAAAQADYERRILSALAPASVGVTVKPMDVSNLLKHAFLSGFVAAKERPSHEIYDGIDVWPEYDPTECAAYDRIQSALYPAPAPVSVGEAARYRIAKAIYEAECEADMYTECCPNWSDFPDQHWKWLFKADAALRAFTDEGEKDD